MGGMAAIGTALKAALPTVAAGFSVLSAAKSLFTPTPKAPKQAEPAAAPEVTAPTVMPTSDDARTQEAKRRSLAMQAARGGRASTILTDNDSFGGGN